MALVIVVDDDADIRTLLRTIVEREGHTVKTAGTVPEAEALLGENPALLFVDVDMPGETGVEMVFKMRRGTAHVETPVVFVTAYPERARVLQSTGHGALAVIPKPFRIEQIKEVLGRVFAGSP